MCLDTDFNAVETGVFSQCSLEQLAKTSFRTHPAWLHDLMVTIEAVLNLHQLLKVVLRNEEEEGR